MKSRKKLVRVVPLLVFYEQYLGVSRSKGAKLRNTDPDFPVPLLVGVNRYAVREDDAVEYQAKLQRRAQAPRLHNVNLRDPRAAAAKSVAKRRDNAAKRRAQIAEGTR